MLLSFYLCCLALISCVCEQELLCVCGEGCPGATRNSSGAAGGCRPNLPMWLNVSHRTDWVSLQPGLRWPGVPGLRVEVNGQVPCMTLLSRSSTVTCTSCYCWIETASWGLLYYLRLACRLRRSLPCWPLFLVCRCSAREGMWAQTRWRTPLQRLAPGEHRLPP